MLKKQRDINVLGQNLLLRNYFILNYINNLRVNSKEIQYKTKVFIIILFNILKR